MLEGVSAIVAFVQDFFLRVKDLVRRYKSGAYIDGYCKFTPKEKELAAEFSTCQTAVHEALCGNAAFRSGRWS